MKIKLFFIIASLAVYSFTHCTVKITDYGVEKPYKGPRYEVEINKTEEKTVTSEAVSDVINSMVGIQPARRAPEKVIVTKKVKVSLNASEALAHCIEHHDQELADILEATNGLKYITNDGMALARAHARQSTALYRACYFKHAATCAGLLAGAALGYIVQQNEARSHAREPRYKYVFPIAAAAAGGVTGFLYALHAKSKAHKVYNLVLAEYAKRFPTAQTSS